MSSPEEWLVCGLCSAKVFLVMEMMAIMAWFIIWIIIVMMKSIMMIICDDDGMILNQVRQMFNNPVHRRLLARLLKVELEVIPSRFPS